jgi:hypothetical protein
MIENIILWLVIGAAAIFSGRTAYRTLTGRSKGCGSCNDCDVSSPAPQQSIPDLTGKKSEEEEEKQP